MLTEIEKSLRTRRSITFHHIHDTKDWEDKPVILVINESKDKLNGLKARASEEFKWIFVRNEESANKYLNKHKADYILRDK